MMDWLEKKLSKDANHSSISSSLLEVSRAISITTMIAFIVTILVINLNTRMWGTVGDGTGRPRGKNGRPSLPGPDVRPGHGCMN